jgi:hypothetical protein
MPIVLDGTNGITQADQFNSDSTFGFKNRIINGAMTIDQRNAGASVTAVSDKTFSCDRWMSRNSASSKFSMQQDAGGVTPPAGFSDYLGVTSLAATSVGSSDYYAIQGVVEGYNVADFNWGTANAKTITLSFWVRSSLTGTFGGSLTNYDNTQSYIFNYNISTANTWEQKSITIVGPTTGTWNVTNSGAFNITFSLGVGSTFRSTANSWLSGNFFTTSGETQVVGTNGATFYITGVQLEVGSTATSFDYLDYGRSLIQCQRYFQTFIINSYSYAGNTFGTNDARTTIPLLVSMRTAPTGITIIGTVAFTTPGGSTNGTPTFHNATINQISILSGVSGYAAAGGSSSLTGGGTIQVSTEL